MRPFNALARLFSRREQRSNSFSSVSPLPFGYGVRSDAGETVTPETAMAASAVFACVRVVSQALGGVPFHVSARDTGRRVDGHRLEKLLNRWPNDEMISIAFKESMVASALLYGAGYAYIERNADGRPTSLWPLPAGSVRPHRTQAGELLYKATARGRSFDFSPYDVFVIGNFSADGITPFSPIRFAANPIGLALALERYGCRFFSNGAQPGGILELPKGMSKPAIKEFVDSWKENNAGPDNAFKTALFTDGMKWHASGIAPEHSQMVDTRVFQVREVARIYGVPLHMIADLERATFSNIEHQAIEFQQRTIQPWAQRFEQESERKLLTAGEFERLNVRANLDALLRADIASRYAAYSAGRQGGWLSVNDIRRREGLPPIDGGDTYLSPLNMTPAAGPTPAAATDTPAGQN
jgi:HK97 family phage portal protein